MVGPTAGWWCEPVPGVGDLERGVGKEFRVPAGTVQDVVVPVAKKYQVRQRRRPVVLPEPDVVCPSHQCAGRSQPGKRQ